jgi:uncharacterized coiled-coil protein SlyX
MMLQQETAGVEETSDYNRKAPAWHRKKRRQVNMVCDETEFPSLPNQSKNNNSNKQPTADNNNSGTQSQTNTSGEVSSLTKSLAAAESKWAKDMNEIQVSFTKRNDTFANAMKTQMEKHQEAFETQIQAQQKATETLSAQVTEMHKEVNDLKTILNAINGKLDAKPPEQARDYEMDAKNYFMRLSPENQRYFNAQKHNLEQQNQVTQGNTAVMPTHQPQLTPGRQHLENVQEYHQHSPSTRIFTQPGNMQQANFSPTLPNLMIYGQTLGNMNYGYGYPNGNPPNQPAGSQSNHMEQTPPRVGV